MTSEWVPTRKPLEQVAWPDIAPTKANRTAAIWNNAYDKDDEWFGQNLWLTRVATGWALGGSFGQSQKNRIFYPRNLSQMPITIEGQMPNQYQYDRLVYFIKRHHDTALSNDKGSVTQQPLTFALPQALINLPGKNLGPYRKDAFWDGNQIVRRHYRAIYVDGYVLGIKAGHPRWNFAPKFTMDLMVSYDYQDEKVELANQMTKLLQSSAGTYAQTNDQISQNYQALLKINGSRGGGATPTALPDTVGVLDDNALARDAFNQGLGDSINMSSWTAGR